MDKPRVVSFWVDDGVTADDPDRVVKLRARQLCDPHYQAGQSAARLEEAAGLFADGAFDVEDTWDAGWAAGLSDAELDGPRIPPGGASC